MSTRKKQARSFEIKKKKKAKSVTKQALASEKLISSGITSDFQHLLSQAGTHFAARVSEAKKGYFQSISDCLILMTHNKPQSQKKPKQVELPLKSNINMDWY